MGIAFTPSAEFSVGMEMEFQILDGQTWDLVDGVVDVVEAHSASCVVPEFVQNTVEVFSPVCTDVAELRDHFLEAVHDLDATCRSLGYRLGGAGTHPFNRTKASITPMPRYLTMSKYCGYWGFNQITFATHVHLGVPGGEEAMWLMTGLKPFLPLLIAVSANSPYWRSEDTRFAAFRHRLLAPSRSYGLPPAFSSWAEFERFYEAMVRSERMASMDEMHWDIRPRPHLGTVEVRVMDAQIRIRDALALAGFLRALARFLMSNPATTGSGDGLLARDLPWWAQKDNCYLASRSALRARVITDESGHVERMTALLDRAFDAIEPHAAELGELAHLDHLRRTVAAGGPYSEQRRLFERHRRFEPVVAHVSSQLTESLVGVV